MKTVTLQSEVGPDRKLHLDVPCDLPPGPVEVVVVVQPQQAGSEPPYDTLEGVLAGKVPLDADIETDLRTIRGQWRQSLEFDN